LTLSADGDTRQRLSERIDEAYLTVRMQKSKGKTADWASAKIQLAEALTALAGEEEDREAFDRYEQAIAAYNQALEVLDAQEHLGEWGGAIVSFARTLRNYAAREGGHMSLVRLDHAEDLLNKVIDAIPEDKGLFDCAMLHIELAYVCRTQASIDREETRLGHLHAAAAHFKQAAQILRMKENFDNWAVAIVGQATAWRDIAAIKRGDVLPDLYRARDLLGSVLNYYTAKTHPMDWMFSHFEYGRIWLRIALADQGKNCYEAAAQAISALRTAIDAIIIENTPDLWPRFHGELALALTTFASVSEDEEAIRSVGQAVEIYRMLSGWYEGHGDRIGAVMMQANLGKELGKLAGLVADRESLDYRWQAVEALRRATPPFMEEILPDEWLTNMFELGAALHSLTHYHEPDDVEALREEAVSVYRRALKNMDEEKNPTACAIVQNWLGLALSTLGEQDDSEEGTSRLREAELCFRRALTLRDEGQDSSDFIRLESNLGHLFYTLARRSDEAQARDYCDQALRSLSRAQKLVDRERAPLEWCNIQSNYAMILLHRVRRDLAPDRQAECERAAAIFRQTIEVADAHAGPVPPLFLRRNLALLLSNWGKLVTPKLAWPLHSEALALLQDIRTRIREQGLKNMEDLVNDEDIEEMEAELEACRPRTLRERLLAWLP